MSDPYGSYGNPYGAGPPYPSQIPASYLTPPPGSPLPPLSGWQPPAPAGPTRRPGVVTAGGVVAIVCSGIWLLLWLLILVGSMLAYKYPDGDPADAISGSDLLAVLLVGAVALGFGVFCIVLATLAFRRRQWARIVLVVLGFVGCWALLPLATAILLLLPPAGQWYATRHAPTLPAPPFPPDAPTPPGAP